MPRQSQYRVQHVATTPSGWRVRSIFSGSHVARIAFPPGRIRKGSGKLVELLHPKKERNPECPARGLNPSELLIFGLGGNPRRNPGWRVYKVITGGKEQPLQSVWPSREAAEESMRRAQVQSPRGKFIVRQQNPGKKGRKNIAAGFYDEDGEFHPIRASYDYSPARAGEKPKRRAKKRGGKKGRKNIAAGFYDEDGEFHPIRASYDYSPARAGEKPRRRARHSGKRRGKRRNPGETAAAEQLYRVFHGKDPKGVIEKSVSAEMRKDYAALGPLDYVKFKTPIGGSGEFTFYGDGVTLASSPDGKQLYVIGGNQNVAPLLDADSLQKDIIDIGDCTELQYQARKRFDNFEPVAYFHKFGEDSGDLPRLFFSRIQKQLFFAGGNYKIDKSGEISPGIEN